MGVSTPYAPKVFWSAKCLKWSIVTRAHAPRQVHPVSGRTPLLHAVCTLGGSPQGRAEVVRELCKRGADANKAGRHNNILDAHKGHNACNRAGLTPLIAAAKVGVVEGWGPHGLDCVAILLDHGAEIDACDASHRPGPPRGALKRPQCSPQ